MKTRQSKKQGIEKLGSAIGNGLLAGLAGTVAITISQIIEMKLTEREPSTTPARAVEKTLDIQPTEESSRKEFSEKIHWIYGTLWGLGRGFLSLMGLKGFPATLAHGVAVTSTAFVMLPALKVAPPVREWGKKEMMIEILHHSIYAFVVGAVFDALEDN